MVHTSLIIPDVHLQDRGIPKAYQLVKKFIEQSGIEIDYTILLGDFMDCTALSHWNQNKRKELENRRYLKECEQAESELDFWQKHTRNKLVWLGGNHDCSWPNQYVEKFPELEGKIEVPYVCHLKERGITWLEYNKLFRIGHLYFTHGMWAGQYCASKHLRELGCNIVFGHIHRTQHHMSNMKMQQPIMAQSLGCLCEEQPDWLKGRHANWIHGFGICYHDTETGNFNLYPVNIVDHSFTWEKETWTI